MAMPIFQQRPVDNIHLPSSVCPVVEFIDTFFVSTLSFNAILGGAGRFEPFL